MSQKIEDSAITEGDLGQISELQKELSKINARNKRVEIDKAWERSRSRIFFLLLTTYVIASLVFLALEAADPFLSALIPTVGYLISTFSLPAARRRWQRRYFPGAD